MQNGIPTLINNDKILKNILDTYGSPIIQKRKEGFESMCLIILEQQVSIASAKACYHKIEKLLTNITPESIIKTSDVDLKICGVSRQKTRYLKDLASKVISKEIDFESFSVKTESEIRNELITIKGVGNWSIDVYLMLCLQLQDIIPLGDIAIKNTLIELYNCQNIEEMERLSNNWKPFRTFASFVIWHYYLEKRK